MTLGPIHFWLYNKIGNQELLTATIATQAKQKGWIADATVYTKQLPKLEDVIDESNIHGWLQQQIADGEIRYGKLLLELQSHREEVRQIAYAFGEDHAVDANADATDIYQYFEDFFVNGMPCDHVNRMTCQSLDGIAWEMVQDIHQKFWPQPDTSDYYDMRKAVMDGMLQSSDFQISMSDRYHYEIRK